MKMFSAIVASFGMFAAAPAFAAPVTMTFVNDGSESMVVQNTNICGVLSPEPGTVLAGDTSQPSSTNCGGSVSVASVVYAMGTKTCNFTISTLFTAGNPILGTPGHWTPKATAAGGSSAGCRVVSQDVSQVFTTGAFAAVFSMG